MLMGNVMCFFSLVSGVISHPTTTNVTLPAQIHLKLRLLMGLFSIVSKAPVHLQRGAPDILLPIARDDQWATIMAETNGEVTRKIK